MNQAKPLFGTTLKSFSTNDFLLSETEYLPYAKLPIHSHNFAYFCFVLRGDYLEKRGGTDYHCRTSTVVFHPPNDPHSNSFHRAGGRCLNIRLSDLFLNRIGKYVKLPENSIGQHSPSPASIKKLYREFCDPDEFSPLSIESTVLEMFAEISRKNKSGKNIYPDWLKMTRDLLHDQFAEPLSLDYIAEAVGRHHVHIAREFHRYFGCTVGEYIRRLRVEFTIRELSKTNRSLSEIALNAGFSDQSHFTKTFRRVTGKTPSEFRRSLPPR